MECTALVFMTINESAITDGGDDWIISDNSCTSPSADPSAGPSADPSAGPSGVLTR